MGCAAVLEFSRHLMNSILLYSFYPLEKAKHCITGFYKPQGILLHLNILPEAILAMEPIINSRTKCPSMSSDFTKFSLHRNSSLTILSTFWLKSCTRTCVFGLPPFLLRASTPAVKIADILPGASGQYPRGPSINITSQSTSYN